MNRLLDTIREMGVVVVRMEKRPTKAETPIETSKPERVLPPQQ